MWSAQGLEMSTGKVPFLEALNGSTVLLPCTYASCIGIKNLYFNWQYNDNGTMQKVGQSCPDLTQIAAGIFKVSVGRSYFQVF